MTYERMLALRRNFLMKLLLALVVAFLVVQLLKFNSGSEIVRELQQSGRLIAAIGDSDGSNPDSSAGKDAKEQPVSTVGTNVTPAPVVPTTQPPSMEERVKSVSFCH